MYKRFKPYLGKLNFCIGNNPKIEKTENPQKYIPIGYKAVLLFSVDFELAWAWRYSKSSKNPVDLALQKAKIERQNLPGIVDLCDFYEIPMTWATIGHLFLDNCTKNEGLAHCNLNRLDHFENDFWKYSGNDWFEYDPCTNLKMNPEWYCPDLIKSIIESPIGHEIACHTFSHIDCSNRVCPPEILKSELHECKRIAKDWDLTLKSFVHPGYSIGNLEVLKQEGFTNFRTNNRNLLGYPKKHINGLWEFEQTTEIVYRKDWTLKYHVFRYCEIIRRAIKSNTVAVLWFHPSFDPLVVQKIMPELFKFINSIKDDIWICTHTEYINYLEEVWR